MIGIYPLDAIVFSTGLGHVTKHESYHVSNYKPINICFNKPKKASIDVYCKDIFSGGIAIYRINRKFIRISEKSLL